MEVWWAGFIARPLHLLIYFGFGFLLLFGYNRYAGLHQDASWTEVAFEAVEEMGLGLLIAAGFLWLLGQIDGATPTPEVLGKVVVEGVTAAIGVSVGSAQLSNEKGEGQGMAGKGGGERKDPEGLLSQIALALCGAVLFSSNVAPTEEILMIAVESSTGRVLGLALLSLAFGGLILFSSDFRGSKARGSKEPAPEPRPGPWTIVSRSVIHYGVALVASAFLLWFFGRFSGMSPAVCAAQTVVLGVAGSLGASAGRLLLQA